MSGGIWIVAPGGAEGRGGIGRLVALIARHWPAALPAATLVDSYGPERPIAMPLHFARGLLRVLGGLLRGRIGTLYIHMAERGSVWRKSAFAWAGHLFAVPVVLHLHGAEFAEFCRALPAPLRLFVRATLRRAAQVVVLGGVWRDFVVGELGVPAERVTVLANAVPGPDRAAPLAEGGPLRLLALGRLGRRKGTDTLLEALARPELRDLDWRLTLAGDGPVEAFRAEAERLGLGGRCHFAGWVDEAESRALLRGCDALVLPSRHEGLPMAILEAMAEGRAVVATPVGSVAEAVRDGETGLLVPPGDPAALAAALFRLAIEPELRCRMGGAGRRRWVRDFAIGPYMARLEAVLAAARRRPAGLPRWERP
ncbi:MAG TPA: glycosyltransferase family 4 protein [Alphaproteobacteria bacterium]|nr:glycosyltransferase family 4 protein [Alphaproteobacteria bacterium]